VIQRLLQSYCQQLLGVGGRGRKRIAVVSVIFYDFPNTNVRIISPCWDNTKWNYDHMTAEVFLHTDMQLIWSFHEIHVRTRSHAGRERTAARGCTAHGLWYVMTHGFITKRKKMKVYVNYGLHCTDFHRTHKSLAVLCGCPLHRISPKSVKKYGKYGYKTIYALSKLWLPLSPFLRKYACSTTICRKLLNWIMKIRQTVLGHWKERCIRSPHNVSPCFFTS
jgi:hypothetical protein